MRHRLSVLVRVLNQDALRQINHSYHNNFSHNNAVNGTSSYQNLTGDNGVTFLPDPVGPTLPELVKDTGQVWVKLQN